MAAIFFDIDGTLWDRDNNIPQSTKEAIHQLQENGHQTFLCSGRTRVFINSEELLGMGFDGIVCGCGTFIEYKGKEMLYKEIDRELLKKAVQIFYDYDIAMVMEGRHMLYMDADKISRDAYGRYLLEVMKDCMLPIQGHEEQWEASKFSVLIHDRDYPAVIELLKDDYDYIIIDNSPFKSYLTTCAMCASNKIITPICVDNFSYDGLMSLFDTIEELNQKYALSIEFAGMFMTRVAGRTTLYKQMYESYENMFGDKFLPVSIRNCIAVNESNTLFEPLLTYDKRCSAAQDYIELVNYLGLMDNKHFRELAKYLKGEKK